MIYERIETSSDEQRSAKYDKRTFFFVKDGRGEKNSND